MTGGGPSTEPALSVVEGLAVLASPRMTGGCPRTTTGGSGSSIVVGAIGCTGKAKASRSDWLLRGSSTLNLGSFGTDGGRRPPKKTMTRPINCFMLALVSQSVKESSATMSRIQAPAVPTSAWSAQKIFAPTTPPRCGPPAPNTAVTSKKYASALVPRPAIMRGTLISKKTIAPKRAISTGKSGAASPKSRRSSTAVQPPMAPE